jgi:hypothetical protein
MKIPKCVYDKIAAKEQVIWSYGHPKIGAELQVLGRNSESSELYDKLLSMVNDNINLPEHLVINTVETTIDKNAKKVTHCYHYDDVTGDAVEFNSFEKLHDIMWKVLDTNSDEIESINNATITKNNVYLSAGYSELNEISASIHQKDDNTELILSGKVKTHLDESLKVYLLSEIKQAIDFWYLDYKLIVELEIYESEIESLSIAWEEYEELEITDHEKPNN